MTHLISLALAGTDVILASYAVQYQSIDVGGQKRTNAEPQPQP